ncbi:SDR family NAD(P)-dependent oxidoreductase [Ciceribacter sp. L1K23]|uniref:SDR family NAD(P)-dependent oxidoreductase n=1 Tax=Ciceribacter sp. L1K23 TaxID=2820276 RepID=UPI001B83492B|nr:SDR family NAD(P)-dependent oxidoreductase [Ciceribacter sp. L1K23]MBR0555498.1 SDR family NAD(P)-dependent oxidoreductase [Ciceribacter sp. L1K23]
MSGRKVAVITGAGRGLGLETGRRLAERGYRVVLTGRQMDAVKAAATGIGDDALAVELDVSSDISVAAAFDAIAAKHGRVDVLVNNAGRLFVEHSQGLHTDASVLAQAIDNNALGAWRTTQKALPIMSANGFGRIVNVSSGMGAFGSLATDTVAYRLSKTALNAITVISASGAGPGIKINAVCPGWVRTDMGGSGATRSLEEGVRGIVWAATLPEDGPTGGFFRDGRPIAW